MLIQPANQSAQPPIFAARHEGAEPGVAWLMVATPDGRTFQRRVHLDPEGFDGLVLDEVYMRARDILGEALDALAVAATPSLVMSDSDMTAKQRDRVERWCASWGETLIEVRP